MKDTEKAKFREAAIDLREMSDRLCFLADSLDACADEKVGEIEMSLDVILHGWQTLPLGLIRVADRIRWNFEMLEMEQDKRS